MKYLLALGIIAGLSGVAKAEYVSVTASTAAINVEKKLTITKIVNVEGRAVPATFDVDYTVERSRLVNQKNNLIEQIQRSTTTLAAVQTDIDRIDAEVSK
jgi:hypothetical protein